MDEIENGEEEQKAETDGKRAKKLMMAKMITRAAQEEEVAEMAAPIEQHEALQDPEFQAGLKNLRIALKFTQILEETVPKFTSLLKSQSNTDVIETLKMLQQCCPFSIRGFDSLQRKMLCLSFSKNENVQRSAIETFQELKLNKPGSKGESASSKLVATDL